MTTTAPASVGMPLGEVETPALVLDLAAFERNLATMARFVDSQGVRLRAHAKTHRSVDVAQAQMSRGGACGLCCQTVGEAEALVDGGLDDVMISNQVVTPRKIGRLAALAARARILVCVDDGENVDALAATARGAGAEIEALVEIDVGAGRCGVAPGEAALALARRIDGAEGLRFAGLQAYQGRAQHIEDYARRRAAITDAIGLTRETVTLLDAEGLPCAIVGGAGTGTYPIEGTSGVYNELQCGSYIFMDAHYGRVRGETGAPLDAFEHSLFVYASILSTAKPGQAVCDAGLKAHSLDSGPPLVFGRDDLRFLGASDEHGRIDDPGDSLRLNDKLMLIPGHCDPTVNLHEHYVCVRDSRVEALWPVTARGRSL